MSFCIGDTVGDYVILEELGAGGAGQVYKVEHIITRRLEAIKVLAGAAPSVRDNFQHFLKEIQLQASLVHPNIAAVLNAFWTGDLLVMVMELLEGSPLERQLQNGRIPLEIGVGIIRQVLTGLDHAHRHGVIHRDVSPSNIIVARENKVKLADFGLAAMAADLRSTQDGAFQGSYHYSSPEQIKGTGVVDARSDIYSCGAVLYEVVTGRKPFNYDNAFSLMQAHVEQEPLPPHAINPSIPLALSAAILRAVAKDPAARFRNADEFRDALDALDPFALCLASAGVTDETPDQGTSKSGEPASDPVRAAFAVPPPIPATGGGIRRWVLGLAIGILIALAAGFASIGLPARRTSEPARQASVPAPPLEPATAPESPVITTTPGPTREQMERITTPAPVRKARPPSVAATRRLPPQPMPKAVIQNATPQDPPPLVNPEPHVPAPVVALPPQHVIATAPVPAAPPPAVGAPRLPAATATPQPVKRNPVRRFFGRVLNPVRRKDNAATEAPAEAPKTAKP